MGRTHVLCGLTAGVGLAGVLGDAPLPVRLLVVPVCGGAALLPDLDHRSSKVARSLGPVTKALAAGINSLALAVYHGTRTDEDSAERQDGHRTATHTIPGCLLFGAGVALVDLAGPAAVTAAGWPARVTGLPVAVCLALLVALMGLGMQVHGWGLSAVGGGASWWVTTTFPTWWWVWPCAVTLGCVVHVAGDACTSAGVPLCWPLVVHGERWYRVTTPTTFRTGTTVESHIVTPVLYLALVAVAGLATGMLPALVGAVSVMLGG